MQKIIYIYLLVSTNTESTELAMRNEANDLQTWSAASQFLKFRSYIGLEQKIGETPAEKAKEGRSGLPKGYQNEGENK